MTDSPIDPEVPDDSRRGERALIALGGVVVLAIGTVLTLGAALIGVAAITVAWFVKRRGQRPLTRGVAWFISVAAIVIPLLLFLIVTSLSTPKRTPDQVRRDLVTARARQRDSMPAWLKGIPGAQPQGSATVDSMTQKLVENSGFMVWFTAMASFIGSSLVGIYAGTVGWGAAMIFFRAAKGEWLPTGRDSALPIGGP